MRTDFDIILIQILFFADYLLVYFCKVPKILKAKNEI